MSAADDAEADFYAALGAGDPEAVAAWARMSAKDRTVSLRLSAPFKDGAEVRMDGELVGRALRDSIPDSNYPGYHLVLVALDLGSRILIPRDGIYALSVDTVPSPPPAPFPPFKDIIGELANEAKGLNEITAILLGFANEYPWNPTRDAAQAWRVAEKLGISVVRLPEGKGWMAGKFDEEMDFFETEIGWVDGCIGRPAVAMEMPLAVCRAAKRISEKA